MEKEAHKTYLVIEFVIIFYVYSRSTAGELCAHTQTHTHTHMHSLLVCVCFHCISLTTEG